MSEKRRLGRPPKSTASDTRTAILDVALDLFSTHGYEATSIRQIAEKVGVSDPALYSHFRGKSEILETIFETHGPKAVFAATENLDLSEALRNPKTFALTRLHNLAERWFQPSEHKFFRLLLLETLTGNLDERLSMASLQRPIRQRLKTLASWLVSTERAIKVDPEWMVSQFVEPLVTLRIEIATNPGRYDLDTVKKKLSDHFDNFRKLFLPGLESGV